MNNSEDHPIQEHEDEPEPPDGNGAVVIDPTETSHSKNATNHQPIKRPRIDNECKNGEDEGETCSICLEMWSDAGEHRLCAMKCGHLFGRSCIEMWLKNNKICPTCKKRGLKRDLRNLYCSKMVALEESAVLDVKARLHESEMQRDVLETVLVQYGLQRDQFRSQVTELKTELQAAHAQLQRTNGFNKTVSDVIFRRLLHVKTVQLSVAVGCRVMDHNAWLNTITCSMKCPTSMFGSYGLTKLNMSNFKITGSIPLHTAPIRDVRFQAAGGSSLLITASMDKHARLVDIRTPGSVRTYAPSSANTHHAAPLWACCWGDPTVASGSYTVFLGEQQGVVVELDVRQMTQRISTLKVEGDMSPIVSLQTLPTGAVECLPSGALLVCHLSSLCVYERMPTGEYKLRILHDPPSGPFMNLSVDRRCGSRHMLLSARPNSSYAFARHMYGELKEDNSSGKLTFVPIHTFPGGLAASLLSRGSITSKCACAYVENTRTVNTWSLTTGQMLPSCHEVAQPVLDIAMFEDSGSGGTNHVLALDDRMLHVFNLES